MLRDKLDDFVARITVPLDYAGQPISVPHHPERKEVPQIYTCNINYNINWKHICKLVISHI